MDAVDRNGLVAPWTAVPHLLALTADPDRCALMAGAPMAAHVTHCPEVKGVEIPQ